MKVYQTDADGFFVGVTMADKDPLDSGNWLIPGGCVSTAPPALSEGQKAQWKSNTWFVIDPEPEEPEPEPDPITAQQIKDEAYRRIITICPEWKQRNLTAQASILAEKGRGNWTTEELAAWEAGEAIWSEIADIRAKSDEIELMDPIPQDYTEDKWWT